MEVFIWIYNFVTTDNKIKVGGVETYIFELFKFFIKQNMVPVIITVGHKKGNFTIDNMEIISISASDWWLGKIPKYHLENRCSERPFFHLVATSQAVPRNLENDVVVIQHGVPWDRPSEKFPWLFNKLNSMFSLMRLRRGVSFVNSAKHIVCVDYVFPTLAACITQPFDWKKFSIIPNFAPDSKIIDNFSDDINKIVFSRRFVKHRGVEVFCDAIKGIFNDGWGGEVHFVGEGEYGEFIHNTFKTFPQVKIYRLDYSERLSAFDSNTLAIIPSLSSEGTSLSCIEAWSKGAVVLSTGVGGLSNLVIDRHNGLVVRPTSSDIKFGIDSIINNKYNNWKLKQNGFNTYLNSFTKTLWENKWKSVVDDLK